MAQGADTTRDTSRAAALESLQSKLRGRGIDVLRLGYPDLMGTERGRDVMVRHLARTVADGVAFCRSVYATTPMGDVVEIEGGLADGLPDVLAVPDISTVQDMPFEPGVAHCIADVVNPDAHPGAGEPATGAPTGDRPLRRTGSAPHRRVRSWSSSCSSRIRAPRAGWRRYGEGTGNVYVGRAPGRSGERAAPDPAPARRLRTGGRRRESRVLQRAVRDQPLARRRARRGRPGVPVPDGGEGAGPSRGQAGDVHGQAVQRRGRIRFPPALLGH